MTGNRERPDDDPAPEVRVKASGVLGKDGVSSEIYNAVKEHELELNRATAAFEHAALKSGIILNGGAATAFTTLIGAINEGTTGNIDQLFGFLAVGSWTVGLVCAAVAVGLGWHSQRAYTRYMKRQRSALEYQFSGEEHNANFKINESHDDAKVGRRSQENAIRLALAAYTTFVIGVILALIAIAKV